MRDRIKAVLLKNEGWSNKQIAQALRIHEETVREHLTDWLSEQKLKPENGGSSSKLSEHDSSLLQKYVESTTYVRVSDICHYVSTRFGIYTISGMRKWLKSKHFSYKKPKVTPVKVDVAQQEAFIESYLELQEKTPKSEPIVLMDQAHPTMETKVSRAWIRKGTDKLIAKTGARTRVNVTGAIDLNTMKVVSFRPEKVNAETTVVFLKNLKRLTLSQKQSPFF